MFILSKVIQSQGNVEELTTFAYAIYSSHKCAAKLLKTVETAKTLENVLAVETAKAAETVDIVKTACLARTTCTGHSTCFAHSASYAYFALAARTDPFHHIRYL